MSRKKRGQSTVTQWQPPSSGKPGKGIAITVKERVPSRPADVVMVRGRKEAGIIKMLDAAFRKAKAAIRKLQASRKRKRLERAPF